MKRAFRHPVMLAILWLPSLLAAMLAARSLFFTDWLVWSSRHPASPTQTAAKGYYMVSQNAALLIGTEQATWTGLAPIAVGRTFTHPTGLSYQNFDHPWEGFILGFWADNYVDSQATYTNHEKFVRIPWWAIAVGLLPLTSPTLIYVHRQRRRCYRELNRLCPNCGYDTHATPEKCPECGHLGKPQVRYSRSRA